MARKSSVPPKPAPKKPASQSSLRRPRNVDKGGIEADSGQPLEQAPLRESYGARSGEAPERSGTPLGVASRGKTRPKP